MIEVIYKEEKQEAKGNQGVFSIPRNIRQIGLINENYRIYVEDYVYTFLGKTAEKTKKEENQAGCLAVLLGEIKWAEGVSYVFIRGTIKVESTEAAADHIDFSQEVWTQIQEEEEKYFKGQEIVGWFFAQPELPLKATDLFKRVHLKHFGGGEKVLMLMDPTEREDAFFRYENGFLVKQSGYYLYYEKNPMMQAYMIDKNQLSQEEQKEEVEDEAVKTFRKIIKSKKKNDQDQEEQGGISVFSYAATACLVLAIGVVGINFYQNYRDIQSINEKAEMASASVAEDTGEESQEDEVTMAYPTITPKVQPSETPSPAPGEEEGGQAETEGTDKADTTGTDTADTTETDTQETQTSQSESIEAEEDSADSSQGETDMERFYLEESDERKAKRKAELAQRQESQEETEAETAADSVHSSYVIKPGDTLYQISMEKYGSIEVITEICELNGLSENETIYPGQIIVLP